MIMIACECEDGDVGCCLLAGPSSGWQTSSLNFGRREQKSAWSLVFVLATFLPKVQSQQWEKSKLLLRTTSVVCASYFSLLRPRHINLAKQ